MLGHIAARNRLGRLRLGVAVTDTGRRNPAVTAQAAATLHLLTRGRAILGAQCERDDDRVVGIPEDRNEVGDQIDGKSEVNEQQQQANANAAR